MIAHAGTEIAVCPTSALARLERACEIVPRHSLAGCCINILSLRDHVVNSRGGQHGKTQAPRSADAGARSKHKEAIFNSI